MTVAFTVSETQTHTLEVGFAWCYGAYIAIGTGTSDCNLLYMLQSLLLLAAQLQVQM